MEKLNFHMILQKSFYYVDLVLKKTWFFYSNIFVEYVIHFIQYFLMNRKLWKTE